MIVAQFLKVLEKMVRANYVSPVPPGKDQSYSLHLDLKVGKSGHLDLKINGTNMKSDSPLDVETKAAAMALYSAIAGLDPAIVGGMQTLVQAEQK